mmetsp:Transcript_85565/g.228914  ORF Transcript_85565/g.228914 Transcript_85565/m.228914 type:complete len:206 (+) Transcript_85565:102-719(+)
MRGGRVAAALAAAATLKWPQYSECDSTRGRRRRRRHFHLDRARIIRQNASPFEEVYRPIKRIGGGGHGSVWRCEHRDSLMHMAVKRVAGTTLLDEHLFESELKALQPLDHPHVVRLVEYFKQGGEFILVLQLCEGPDLLDFFNGYGGTPAAPVLGAGGQSNYWASAEGGAVLSRASHHPQRCETRKFRLYERPQIPFEDDRFGPQ